MRGQPPAWWGWYELHLGEGPAKGTGWVAEMSGAAYSSTRPYFVRKVAVGSAESMKAAFHLLTSGDSPTPVLHGEPGSEPNSPEAGRSTA